MASTFSTYRLGAVAFKNFLATKNMPRITVLIPESKRVPNYETG